MLPRPEYPRPQFERPNWMNLNGVWKFEFDDENRGVCDHWHKQHHFSREIIVPFAFQSELSGINDPSFHDVVWYQREFNLPENWNGKRILLHFGAVDYRAQVWVNGQYICQHEGGHTPFQADITNALTTGDNQVTVRVEDVSTDKEQPRGKQYWEAESRYIYYTRTTGIWQTVWLEAVPLSYVERIKMTPDIDRGELALECFFTPSASMQTLEVDITYQGTAVARTTLSLQSRSAKVASSIRLDNFNEAQLWSPETPNLFDLKLRLINHNQASVDEITSYFGMRKISVENGQICLNNRPYYMKLVLDQGYFPDGLLTPPSDLDIQMDVAYTKEMGFNGARKHQKIEDPRYLYWADHLGLLVWGEMANSHAFTETAVNRIMAEWQEAIRRDYNHPCIIAWVPLNESWGVPTLPSDPCQVYHSLSLYYLTKSLDSSRLVISNDGWEHSKSDICTIHDYDNEPGMMRERYQSAETALSRTPTQFALYCPGCKYEGEPIVISEFGGIGYRKSEWSGWGYSEAQTDEDFLKAYHATIATVMELPLIQGFCYTQLTDVEQEINGLMTYDRRFKVSPQLIRAVNEGQSLEHVISESQPQTTPIVA